MNGVPKTMASHFSQSELAKYHSASSAFLGKTSAFLIFARRMDLPFQERPSNPWQSDVRLFTFRMSRDSGCDFDATANRGTAP